MCTCTEHCNGDGFHQATVACCACRMNPDNATPSKDEDVTGRVRQALNGITPLPWRVDKGGYNLFSEHPPKIGYRAMVADQDCCDVARMRGWGSGQPQERNLHAIATVMNAAPSLLAEISTLRAKVEEWESKLEVATANTIADAATIAHLRRKAAKVEELERDDDGRRTALVAVCEWVRGQTPDTCVIGDANLDDLWRIAQPWANRVPDYRILAEAAKVALPDAELEGR